MERGGGTEMYLMEVGESRGPGGSGDWDRTKKLGHIPLPLPKEGRGAKTLKGKENKEKKASQLQRGPDIQID